MPYAVALLDYYLAGMSRHAFDMDYISPGQNAEAKVVEAAAQAEGSVASLEGETVGREPDAGPADGRG